jgi:hypothetical protein
VEQIKGTYLPPAYGWQKSITLKLDALTGYTLSPRGPDQKNNNVDKKGAPLLLDTGFDIVKK